MTEFPHERETYVPPEAEILAENDLFILYKYKGLMTLQDRLKNMWEVSSEFQYRMLLKLLNIKED
jgi:hypothetical protein